ncbi:MAG: sodium:proton antiporter [Aquabacterium sp.]|uniref:cation:proton antiporter domain-containing protein n=1 Tax=Aquabacterium sp. TaxID=1872578 RepID=UPI00120B8955|nr:cation:proton antiporter [Aquabacterium sp.]TAK93762.1 MAG: sodium:proton antiporter [Aquabacterium sp.]
MPHDVSLISTIAAGFGLALLLGYAATRLRMPPLVGYLLAGVVIGPATPGFVADMHLAGQLAEIGVMLLMFGVGLHFSLSDLMAVRRIAIPGAVVQIVVAVAMGLGLAHAWGWGLGASLVFGLCLSVASTVVLLKALESRGLIETVNGRIAIGWLVVEDLVMVLVLVLMPAVAGMLTDKPASTVTQAQPLWLSLMLTLAKVMAFIATMLLIGRRVLPKMLWWVARTGSRELFTLSVVASAVGVAFGAAKLFDVSFALGAFFAGMMMQESEFSHRAADESLPLRDAFAVLFFVSVGMLFDPAVLWHAPGKLAATVAVILLGKTLAAVVLVLLFRYPLNTALTVGVSLAQIGEFSFILAGLGVSLGLLPQEGQSLILAAAIVSIAANAGFFGVLSPLLNWAREHSALARRLEARDDPLAQLPTTVDQSKLHGQVVLVGYGQVGQRVASMLHDQKVNFVVVDEGRDVVESLRQAHIPAVTGDLSDPATLIQAHIARAGALVITLPDSVLIHQLVDVARQLNVGIRILVYCASEDEAALLEKELEVDVFVLEQELAKGMARQVVQWIKSSGHDASNGEAPQGH